MPCPQEHRVLSLFFFSIHKSNVNLSPRNKIKSVVNISLSMIWFDREWQLLQPEQQDCPYILHLPKKEISVTYLQKGRPSQLFLRLLVWEQESSQHLLFVHQLKERYNYHYFYHIHTNLFLLLGIQFILCRSINGDCDHF